MSERSAFLYAGTASLAVIAVSGVAFARKLAHAQQIETALVRIGRESKPEDAEWLYRARCALEQWQARSAIARTLVAPPEPHWNSRPSLRGAHERRLL